MKRPALQNKRVGVLQMVIRARKAKSYSFFFFQSETTNTNAKNTIYLMRKTTHYACSTHTPFTHSLHALVGIYPVARAKFESRAQFESGSKVFAIFFLLIFHFFSLPNDVRQVTRNIIFPVSDIFQLAALPMRVALASPRYTTSFNINSFSKNH